MDAKKEPADTARYFVVLKSDSLNAPALFLSFADCSFYINQEDNELPVEYKSFDTLNEATAYLKLSRSSNESSHEASVAKLTTSTDAATSTKTPSLHKTRKRRHQSVQKENVEFDEMIKQLGDFREKGTAIRSNPKLQHWVSQQRKEYQRYKQKDKSTMTPQRIVELAIHGFNFEAKKKLTWDERAVQWLEYRSRTGGDPKRYSSDGLGKWVLDQRKKHKMLKDGAKTNLTEDQVQKLTGWGFSWEHKIKVASVVAERKPWDYRFQQLISFKEQHGHTAVPQSTPELGHWVRSQRSDYGKFLKGQKCGMTKERLQNLNSIGFAFHCAQGGTGKKVSLIPHGARQDNWDDGDAVETQNRNHQMVDDGMARVPLHLQRQQFQGFPHDNVRNHQFLTWDRCNNDSAKRA